MPVGYSDHTLGIHISIAAVALGATIIEKHFTLDKNLTGPDHSSSLNPSELIQLVQNIRNIEDALGNGEKLISKSEYKNLKIARKFVVASTKINKGEIFSKENISVKRSGGGESPFKYWEFLGKKSKNNYKKDQIINE